MAGFSRPLEGAQGAPAPSSVAPRSPHAARPGRRAGNPRREIPALRRRARRRRAPVTASPYAGRRGRPPRADRRRVLRRRDRAGEIGHHQTLGAVSDARQQQRPARREALRRRGARSHGALMAFPGRSSLRVEAKKLASTMVSIFGGYVFGRPSPRHTARRWALRSAARNRRARRRRTFDIRVGKSPDDQIRLAHAAAPGAEQ